MSKIFLFLTLWSAQTLHAQTLTGSWFGQADVEMEGIHSNYLTELIIKQKGDEIEGIFGYYFKDIYQSFYIHGDYNLKTHEISIRNIPIIYFNSNFTVNSIDCNTDFEGEVLISKVKRTIRGHFYHDGKYKYTCPDLRVLYTLDMEDKQQATEFRNTVTGKTIWKPQPEDFIVTTSQTQKEALVPIPVQRTDSVDSPLLLKPMDITPTGQIDSKKISEAFVKRKPIFSKDLTVSSDSVELSFYDNGDIDGDSISVFLNNKLVLIHQGLTAKAINLFVRLDSTRDINEITMFAENLGTIPPNTALMVVLDGIHRYEVYMSSNLTENATVRLLRNKK